MKSRLVALILCNVVQAASVFGQYSSEYTFPDSTLVFDIYNIPGTANYISYGEYGMLGITRDFGKTFEYDQSFVDTVNSYPGTNYQKVHFCNSSVGYAVGSNRLLVKTLNGGTSWTVLSHEAGTACGYTLNHYVDVFAVTEDTVLVMVTDGNVIRSIDGGITFNVVLSGIHGDMHFPSDSIGYLCDDLDIYKSTDAGATWNLQYQDLSASPWDNYHQIFFRTDSFGYAIRNDSPGNLIKMTTDGGSTWSSISNITEGGYGSELTFLNDSTGFFLMSRFYLTRDSGNTWVSMANADSLMLRTWGAATWPPTVAFNSVDSGLFVSAYKTVFETTNSAQNWSWIPSHFKPDGATAIRPTNDTTFYALGRYQHFDTSGVAGDIYQSFVRSDNGGNTWSTPLETPVLPYANNDNMIRDFRFVNRDTGVFFTRLGFYYSNDGAGTWTQSPVNSPNALVFYTFDFKDEMNGIAAANGPGDICVILQTVDGGLNWNEIYFERMNFPYSFLTELHYFDSKIVRWHADQGYSISVSIDDGATWSFVPIPAQIGTGQASRRIHIHNEDVWTLVYWAEMEIHRTTDGGATWNLIHYNSNEEVMAPIHFTNEFIGIAHTQNGQWCGKRKLTVDGGVTWSILDTMVIYENYSNTYAREFKMLASTDPSTLLFFDASADIIKLSCDGPTPQLSLVGDQSICENDSITITASGGNNYLWSDGSTGPSLTVNTAGTYHVTSVSSEGCPKRSALVNVVVEQLAIIDQIGAACIGDSISLSAPQSTSYLWSNGSTNQTITINTTGQYFVEVNNLCGTSSDTTDVVFQMPPAITQLTPDTGMCIGDTILIQASGGTSYSWSPNYFTLAPYQSAATVFPDSSTYFVVEVEDSGCSSIDSVLLNVVSAPVISQISTSANSICAGESVAVDAVGGSNFSWSPATYFIDPNQSSAIAYPTVSGYLVASLNLNGCVTSDSVWIEIVASATISNLTDDTTICPGDTIPVNVDTASGYSYEWIPNSIVQSYWLNSTYAYPDSTTTLYIDIEWLGCHNVDSLIVTVWPALDINLTISADTIYSSALGSSYQWYLDGAPVSQNNIPYLQFSTLGEYQLVITDVNGCSHFSETLSLTSSEDKSNNNGVLSIFPNPTDGEISLKLQDPNQSFEARVYDVSGRLVHIAASNPNSDVVLIDLSQSEAGLYTVKVIIDDKRIVIKRIVRR
jgi:photosystem II stability/assembly factor-like uncharacterized protein